MTAKEQACTHESKHLMYCSLRPKQSYLTLGTQQRFVCYRSTTRARQVVCSASNLALPPHPCVRKTRKPTCTDALYGWRATNCAPLTQPNLAKGQSNYRSATLILPKVPTCSIFRATTGPTSLPSIRPKIVPRSCRPSSLVLQLVHVISSLIT